MIFNKKKSSKTIELVSNSGRCFIVLSNINTVDLSGKLIHIKCNFSLSYMTWDFASEEEALRIYYEILEACNDS